jgi:2-dehydro-3-deoxyphosphogluconate aldolase / (4S)-4-hydroxy-2-oxoglutarate aldolase
VPSSSIVQDFERMGVFPIIVIDDAADARPLGEALLRAGMPCAEITFRTAAAAESIRTLERELPELLLGAGTILSVDQAKQARDAGARFVLTPGFSPTVVDFCLDRDIPIFPGVSTPTEIQAGLERGLTVLKFFPAEAMGGLRFLKAVAAPLAAARYLPTGGISLENLGDYLRFDRVVACAGTWIVKKDWLKEKRFDRIEAEAAAAVRRVGEIRGS